MKVLITGATGLIGSELMKALYEQGDQPAGVSRSPEKAIQNFSFPCEFYSLEKSYRPDILEKFDAVVHLAGENIADGQWTKKKKKKIEQSRVESTQKNS